jgi:hypothetical protein
VTTEPRLSDRRARPSAHRIVRLVVPVLAIGLIVAVQWQYFERGLIPGDAFTYLSAGERLNAGHPLYALSPGDRPVDLNPPFWTVPLLSPPPIAVVFRPLALLGDAGAYVWWLACIAVIVGSLIVLLRKEPVVTGIVMLVLMVPLVYEIGVGNLNAIVVGGLLLTWRFFANHQDRYAGIALAIVTAFKLTPSIFAWWLICQRRWTATRSFVVAGLVLLVVSVIGAGLGSHLEYLSIVRQTASVGTSNLSLSGLARTVGIPAEIANILPYLALVVGGAGIWMLRRRPTASWVMAVVTMLAASPVVNINWFTLLLAALAPLAWPLADRDEPRDSRPGDTRIAPSASA